MKKIVFLGASVTAQRFSLKTGELTGYVEAFKVHHASNLGFLQVVSHAWPGNRLSDAGLICTHQMLPGKPDVAIIEPLVEDRTRGRDFSEQHLHFIFQSCVDAGILPVAFALPKPGGSDPFSQRNYEILKNYCIPRKLPLIPVVIPTDLEREVLYRDRMHTKRQGAEIYAQILSDALPAILAKGWSEIDVESREPVYKVMEVPSNATSDFQSICIRNSKPETGMGSIVILQKQKIGSFSPVVTVAFEWLSGARSTYDLSIWDPYCYYERFSYVKIAETDRSDFNEIRVTVSEEIPSYDTSRVPFNFAEIKNRRFMRSSESFWVISDHPFDLSIEVD